MSNLNRTALDIQLASFIIKNEKSLSEIIGSGGEMMAVLNNEEKKGFFDQNMRELKEAIATLEESVEKDETLEKLFTQIKHNIKGVNFFSNY